MYNLTVNIFPYILTLCCPSDIAKPAVPAKPALSSKPTLSSQQSTDDYEEINTARPSSHVTNTRVKPVHTGIKVSDNQTHSDVFLQNIPPKAGNGGDYMTTSMQELPTTNYTGSHHLSGGVLKINNGNNPIMQKSALGITTASSYNSSQQYTLDIQNSNHPARLSPGRQEGGARELGGSMDSFGSVGSREGDLSGDRGDGLRPLVRMSLYFFILFYRNTKYNKYCIFKLKNRKFLIYSVNNNTL
jgi:hypothetical protein